LKDAEMRLQIEREVADLIQKQEATSSGTDTEGSHFLSPRRPSNARNLGSLRSGSAIGSVGK